MFWCIFVKLGMLIYKRNGYSIIYYLRMITEDCNQEDFSSKCCNGNSNCLTDKEKRIRAGLEILSVSDGEQKLRWYVMRDLKRSNAKQTGYMLFESLGFDVFTPMTWRLIERSGKRIREEVPIIPNLFFVRGNEERIDPILRKNPTIQYRYVKGGAYKDPMTVRDCDMDKFIFAIRNSNTSKYYLPEELTPSMCNQRIRIIGGAMEGYEGLLLTIRGSKKKRLLVNLPNLFSVAVEVSPEYIQII